MKSMFKLTPKFFQERIQLILEISIRFMWLLLYIGLYIFADEFLNRGVPVWQGVLWIVFVAVITALIYYFIRNMMTVLFVYLIQFSVIFYFGYTEYELKSSLILILFFMTAISMGKNLLDCRREYIHELYSVNFLFVALPIVYEIYAMYNRYETFYIAGFIIAVLFMAGHLWCTYVQEICLFMGNNLNLANVPRADIYKSNTRIVCVIIVIFFLVTGFLFLLRYTPVFSMLGGLLGIPIRKGVGEVVKLGRFVHRLMDSEVTVDSEESPPLEPIEVYVTDTFLNVFGVLMGLLLLIFFIAWIVCLVIKKRKPRHKARIIASERADEIEELAPKAKKKKTIFKDNNDKIRTLFRRWIKKKLKPHVPSSKTACELSELAIRNEASEVKALSPDDFDDTDFLQTEDTIKKEELARLYDVARYSGRMVTDEELKSIK